MMCVLCARGSAAFLRVLLPLPSGLTRMIACIAWGLMQDDQTALHYAAFYGHLEVVQLLVEHGVPLDIPDKVRSPPLPPAMANCTRG